MRYLATVLILVMMTALTQAKEAGKVRPTTRPKDPAKASATSPDKASATPPGKLLFSSGASDKPHRKTVQTIIPDICKGC
jgi:hypothetical protein